MSLLSVLDPGAHLHVVKGALNVIHHGLARIIPLHRITAVQLWQGVTVSPSAQKMLVKAGLEVVYLNHRGECVARLVGPMRRSGERRLKQYGATVNLEQRLGLAVAIIAGKLNNQRAVLSARQERIQHPGIWEPLARLQFLSAELLRSRNIEEVRGFEGVGARYYFEGLGNGIQAEGIKMNGRTRRPPRDPVNAALSFLYTLLCTRCEGAIEVVGLDPFVGVVHEASRGQPALALDLAEVFRPRIDRLVMTLFNRQQLTVKDFRAPTAEELSEAVASGEDEAGAVYLDGNGREVVIRAWDGLLRELVLDPVRSVRIPLIELIPRQAMGLVKVFEGEAPVFVPYQMS